MDDYYKILGVPRTATEKEIKRAYRDLARQFHPDLNPGDTSAENRFKQINEAYEVLGDPDKRARYDEYGHFWKTRGNPSDGVDWSRWASNFGSNSTARRSSNGSTSGGFFSEIFSVLFGQESTRTESRPSKTPIRGRDIEFMVNITLEEAYQGTSRKITGERGYQFTAHIPPGSREGTKIRFAAQGKPGFAGGVRGDLYVVVSVEEHPIFERDGDDLLIDLKIDLYTAVLGGEVRIPTLVGDVKLRIPSSTQSGQRIRLQNKGMPLLRDPNLYGDMYVRPLIQVPADLTEEERSLFARLRHIREG